MELHSVTIDGKKISIQRFGAKEGWKLLRKLSSIIAPSLGELAEDNYADAFALVFDKLPENDFMNLLNQITSVCLVDDKKYSDQDLANYMFTLKVVKAVLEYNFEDFFSPIKEVFQGFAMRQMAKT